MSRETCCSGLSGLLEGGALGGGRTHGPVELPAELLALLHVDVVKHFLVHHVRLGSTCGDEEGFKV